MNKNLAIFLAAMATNILAFHIYSDVKTSAAIAFAVPLYICAAALWFKKLSRVSEYRYIQVPSTKEWVVRDHYGRYLSISPNGFWYWTKNKFLATPFSRQELAVNGCAQAREQERVL